MKLTMHEAKKIPSLSLSLSLSVSLCLSLSLSLSCMLASANLISYLQQKKTNTVMKYKYFRLGLWEFYAVHNKLQC